MHVKYIILNFDYPIYLTSRHQRSKWIKHCLCTTEKYLELKLPHTALNQAAVSTGQMSQLNTTTDFRGYLQSCSCMEQTPARLERQLKSQRKHMSTELMRADNLQTAYQHNGSRNTSKSLVRTIMLKLHHYVFGKCISFWPSLGYAFVKQA